MLIITVYQWRNQLEILGERAFLDCQPSYPWRGIKEISAEEQKAILAAWEEDPGFGPDQIRNQLRRQGITIAIRTVLRFPILLQMKTASSGEGDLSKGS